MGQGSVEEHPAEDYGTPQSRAAAATIMRRIKRAERGEARFYTMEESLKDLKNARNTTFIHISILLMLGNGFDLRCGLK